MDIFFVVLTMLAGSASLKLAFGRGADGPSWDLRWRALDPGYQDWLAAMTTSPTWMKTLTDPEESALARGFARRESRRRAYFDTVAMALLVIGFALVLASLLHTRTCVSAFVVYGGIRALADFLRNQQLRRRLKERTDPDVAPPRPAAAAA